MNARKTIDQRPGSVPEIRADGDAVTFRLEIAGVHAGARLVIRCDSDGTVWASMATAPGRPT
jgi:hypothetical protein